MTSVKGVKPLLPGLLGGLGFHNVLVDAEDYYLEEARALFLSSNALLRVNLTKAPPFGTLLGRATVRRTLGEGGYGNVAIEVLDSMGNPLNPVVQAISAANGNYVIPDTVPKGTWQVRFTNPQGTGSIVKDGVQMRAARETNLGACFSSLSGFYRNFASTTRSVRVFDASNTLVGSFSQSSNSFISAYEILGIPPGTYTVEFRSPASSANASVIRPDIAIGDCAARTLSP